MPFTLKETDECEERLVRAAALVEQVERLPLPDAWNLLQKADGRWLMAFDLARRQRSYREYFEPGRIANFAAVLLGKLRPPVELGRTEGLLFILSCSPNGHARETALRSPEWAGHRLACAAILLRIDDWVPEVRRVAIRSFTQLAQSDDARRLFELLDLVAALRARIRFEERWTDLLEPALLAPRWRCARRAAMDSRDPAARRLAFDLQLRAHPDDAGEVLQLAHADPSIRIASWAQEQAFARLDADVVAPLLRGAMKHPLGPVRAQALRGLARLEVSCLHLLLVESLFDTSRQVRAAAAHLLQERFAEPALPHWRATFDAGRRREMLTPVIAECGNADDEARLRSQLSQRKSRTRAAALSGLVRVGAPDAKALLFAGLRDSSTRVVGAAIQGLETSNFSPETRALEEALAVATSPATRARLIAGLRLLSKWDRLEAALAQYQRCAQGERHLLDRLLEAWVRKFNRSYAPLDEQRRRMLLQRVDAVAAAHPAFHWQGLANLLR